MAVGIKLGSITDEIGTPDFFHAFFSTIAGNLEPDGWGTRFPALMKTLYAGELHRKDADEALKELDCIRIELSKLPPDQVIWDIDDRTKPLPWSDNIADSITDLSNYFVTSSGRDLILTLREILEELKARGGTVEVVTI